MAEIFESAAGMVRTLAKEQQNEETFQAAVEKVNSEVDEPKVDEPKKKRIQIRGPERVEKQKQARKDKRQAEFTAAGGAGQCPKYARLAAVIEATGTVVRNINTGVGEIKEGQATLIEGQKLLPQQLVECIANNPEVVKQISSGMFQALEDKKAEDAKDKADTRKAKAAAKKEATQANPEPKAKAQRAKAQPKAKPTPEELLKKTLDQIQKRQEKALQKINEKADKAKKEAEGAIEPVVAVAEGAIEPLAAEPRSDSESDDAPVNRNRA